MFVPLSDSTNKLLEILIPESDRARVSTRLEVDVAHEAEMFCRNTPEGLERARFSILKLIAQHPKNEDIAFNYANTDYRDLFMVAGFGYSCDEHQRWCESVLKR